MAERSKLSIFGRWLAGIAGSNPAGRMAVCVVFCRGISDIRAGYKGTQWIKMQRKKERTKNLGGNIFCIREIGPGGPPSLLYKGYRVCFPAG